MHIKQVIVEGFKTYREQTSADFLPSLNCIGATRRRQNLSLLARSFLPWAANVLRNLQPTRRGHEIFLLSLVSPVARVRSTRRRRSKYGPRVYSRLTREVISRRRSLTCVQSAPMAPGKATSSTVRALPTKNQGSCTNFVRQTCLWPVLSRVIYFCADPTTSPRAYLLQPSASCSPTSSGPCAPRSDRSFCT